MEITKEQIQKVENYLQKKKFDYVDLKHEVLDHMISDIEEKMDQEISFEIAFENIKVKWSPQLKDTFSYLFGVGYTAPKIIIQKAKKIYWKFIMALLGSYFLPFAVLTEANFLVKNPSETDYYPYIQGFLCLIFIIFTILSSNKTTQPKSTYGFILKTLKLNLLVGLIVLLTAFSDAQEMNGIHIGMYFSFIVSVYIYYYFFRKHRKAVESYKIV